MRIGVDATSVLDERTGAEAHAFAAVESLAANAAAAGDEIVAFVRRRVPDRWRPLPAVETVILETTSQALATQVLLPAAARHTRVDVLYCPAKPPPACAPVPVLDAIHDLVPWSRPETMGRRGAAAWYRALDGLALRRGAHVATGSAAAAAEIRRVLRPVRPVHVVGHALSPWLAEHAHACSSRPQVAGEGPYLLSVCRIEPRKDLDTVLGAWERADRGDARLLLVGKVGWKVEAAVARATVTRGVELLGYVDEAELPGLYAHAHGFLTASREEGFGLPVLEALSFGAPVIASDIPAHREVTAGAALLFNPGDSGALAAAIGAVLEDAEVRHRLRAAGRARSRDFSSDALARRLRAALEVAA